MVSFLHIADKNEEKSIVKNGIGSAKIKAARGVYAVPVVPNYAMTHQWARELKRSGVRTLICVQFKIPNSEFVFIGKYNGEKLEMTASEAAATFLKHNDPMGLEVIIPRRIMPMMNGGDLYELAKILGHANIKMTERYAKLGKTHIASTGNTARGMWKLMEGEGGKREAVAV